MKHDRDCETSVIFVLFEGVPIGSRREDERVSGFSWLVSFLLSV